MRRFLSFVLAVSVVALVGCGKNASDETAPPITDSSKPAPLKVADLAGEWRGRASDLIDSPRMNLRLPLNYSFQREVKVTFTATHMNVLATFSTSLNSGYGNVDETPKELYLSVPIEYTAKGIRIAKAQSTKGTLVSYGKKNGETIARNECQLHVQAGEFAINVVRAPKKFPRLYFGALYHVTEFYQLPAAE